MSGPASGPGPAPAGLGGPRCAGGGGGSESAGPGSVWWARGAPYAAAVTVWTARPSLPQSRTLADLKTVPAPGPKAQASLSHRDGAVRGTVPPVTSHCTPP
jgi:hypothetical protein